MENKLIVRFSPASNGGQSLMRLSGPILITNFFDFQNAVRGDTADTLILDLTEVPYVDSAAIGCLVNAHVSRTKAGRRLALVGEAERVQSILSITGVIKVFSLFPTLDAAGESLRQSAGS
jgi:anti-sigma B factor antagonist